ncbi:Aspartate aminotransferase, mitochondrial [Cercospora beticola]|uniref:Aspartate aminotransferase, mitochondrial n=1 Tax=Cercospora beticola TaxID=122368 RepID=A0A2G5IDN8_CERBT|nr:Aspartate aminotransferase, mitochondrial [Cercospora beticola]PIB02967.1 Aspartate aminotransferase, mitochondrial [Cercospora beticola]WPB04380.1 hypothetical protein RHO25_009026 [Cercospora beticola]CAK1356794.1 unnamed protein product [Cercospora beticola]
MASKQRHPFSAVPAAQYNETVYQLIAEYRKDPAPEKTDLMVGVYQDDEGEIYTLPSVIEARRRLFREPHWHHGYRSSQIGSATFLQVSASLFFGENSAIMEEKRVATAQCLGASGACYMAACLLKRHHVAQPTVYLPRETWSNHANIFEHAGLRVEEIPYFDTKDATLDFDAFHAAVDQLLPESVLVLQTAGQNPTGCDPTAKQWTQIAATCAMRGHLIIFDAAYYGMASGSIEQDTECIRICAEANVSIMLCATFSKAFGLYSERVGVLCLTAPNPEVCHRLEMQLRLMTRYETGGYPAFGANIVELILTSPDLRAQWELDVKKMASQLQHRRERLRALFGQLQTPGNWGLITKQKGMFCLMNLSQSELTMLRKQHHVYLQDNGRLSISGITNANIDRVAKSIDSVVRSCSQRTSVFLSSTLLLRSYKITELWTATLRQEQAEMPHAETFQPRTQLPSISFRKLHDGDHQELQRLRKTCSETGIFHLDLDVGSDHSWLREQLLHFAKEYFAQDLRTKLGDCKNEVYGYEPVGTSEGLSRGFSNGYESLKFAFRPTDGPKAGLTGEIIDTAMPVVRKFQESSYNVLMQVLSCLTDDRVRAMHISEKASRTNAVVLRYPHDAPFQSSGHNEHKDMGTLTLLLTEQWGLQIRDPVESVWRYVPPSKTGAIVNVGDSLSFISQGTYTSALHRVERINDGTQEDKYSFAFFLRPADDAEYQDSNGNVMTAADWHNIRTEKKIAGFKNDRL